MAEEDKKKFHSVGQFKYWIVLIIGVLSVGFLYNTSAWNLIKLYEERDDYRAERDKYKRQLIEAEKELDGLKSSPKAVEKVAREKYFMKAEDEDVFVFSTDVD